MNTIVRPVSADGMCGFDEFGQFAISWRDGEYVTMILAHDVRRETCAICLRGWETTSQSLRDQFRWNLLDAVVHESCFIRHESFVGRAAFVRAMLKAGLKHHGFRAIPNQYWHPSDPWAKSPWYEADLLDHAATIVLGRRKNVDHVELRVWDGSTANEERATAAFADEKVTKCISRNQVLIHAWSYEKVIAYLTRIRELLIDGLLVKTSPVGQ